MDKPPRDPLNIGFFSAAKLTSSSYLRSISPDGLKNATRDFIYAGVFVGILILTFAFATGMQGFFFVGLILSVMLFISWAFYKRNFLVGTLWMAPATIFAVTFITPFVLVNNVGLYISFFGLSVLIAGVFVNLRALFVFTIASLISSITFYFFLPLRYPVHNDGSAEVLLLLFLIIIFFAILGYATYMIQVYNAENVDQIIENSRQLQASNERQKMLTESLQVHQTQLEELVLKRTSELLEAKRRAEEASMTKTRFLANMSHELRTPLNSIIGYSELISAELSGDPGHGELLKDAQSIHKAGSHLLKLINEVLMVAKSEVHQSELTIESFLLTPLIQEVAQWMEPIFEKNSNRFVLANKTVGLEMTTDPTRLRQILVNLLTNAAKFTKNGEIVLSVEDDPSGQSVTFEITDTGIGIQNNNLQQIFEPFWQAENPYRKESEGTGLGLSVTQQLCHRMQGFIEVKSAPDVGSTFSVTIPVTYDDDRIDLPTKDAN